MKVSLTILVVGLGLAALTGCGVQCDGCISLPPPETITVEVPTQVIVEVPETLLEVEVINVTPFDWSTKHVLVDVTNISNYTLYSFELSIEGANIIEAYGSSVTYQGSGVFVRGPLIAPGETLELIIKLDMDVDINNDLNVNIKSL